MSTRCSIAVLAGLLPGIGTAAEPPAPFDMRVVTGSERTLTTGSLSNLRRP
jgi:hypothetical protein